MRLSTPEGDWYYKQIEKLDPRRDIVSVDRKHDLLVYDATNRSDEFATT